MESGGISRVIDFLAKRPELDQCRGRVSPNYLSYERQINLYTHNAMGLFISTIIRNCQYWQIAYQKFLVAQSCVKKVLEILFDKKTNNLGRLIGILSFGYSNTIFGKNEFCIPESLKRHFAPVFSYIR